MPAWKNAPGAPTLLRNEGGNQTGNWVELKLVGAGKSNRNAVGARVQLSADGPKQLLTQVDEVHAGDSYLSHSDWRLHFGLGNAAVINEVIIRWPSGATEKLTKLGINRKWTINEGKGVVNAAAKPEPKPQTKK